LVHLEPLKIAKYGEKNMNASILDQDQLAKLTGYIRPSDIERCLIKQGIRPIYGKAGHFFVTKEMINATRGISDQQNHSHDELI
jgi:hypothetical protein